MVFISRIVTVIHSVMKYKCAMVWKYPKCPCLIHMAWWWPHR